MADNTQTRDPNRATKQTWHEREVSEALQGLANARLNLATLEEEMAAGPTSLAGVDPADLDRVHLLHGEIETLRPRAAARFGGGTARTTIEALEFDLHLVLDRLGFGSFDDFHAAANNPAPVVDADRLQFAQREFDRAEKSFLEIATMVIPAAPT